MQVYTVIGIIFLFAAGLLLWNRSYKFYDNKLCCYKDIIEILVIIKQRMIGTNSRICDILSDINSHNLLDNYGFIDICSGRLLVCHFFYCF